MMNLWLKQKLSEHVIPSIPAHMQMHSGNMMITGDYFELDRQQQLLSKGSSKDLCYCSCIADLDFIQNMRKAT